jgi:hypothetical protein
VFGKIVGRSKIKVCCPVHTSFKLEDGRNNYTEVVFCAVDNGKTALHSVRSFLLE